MPDKLQCKPGDKPITIKEEQTNKERMRKIVYIVFGVVLFLFLFYITQINPNSRGEQFLSTGLYEIRQFIRKITSEDPTQITREVFGKMVHRHLSFFVFIAVILSFLASSFTFPQYGGHMKNSHSTENTGKESGDMSTAIYFMVFWLVLILVATNFKEVRPAFVGIFVFSLLYFLFLMYKLYIFNTNVYHMSVQTLLCFFTAITLIGFISFTAQKDMNINTVITLVISAVMVFFSILIYYAFEREKDDKREYLVNEHRNSRIVIYILLAFFVFLVSMFQTNVIFQIDRAGASFLPYAGVPEFFNTKTGAILESIKDVRWKFVATPFVYLFMGIAGFLMGSGKMLIDFLPELKASV
jgi:hypothetical protein